MLPKAKLVAIAGGALGLVVALGAAYLVGRAHGAQECAEERSQALSEAVRLQTAAYQRRARQAEERHQRELERRQLAERRAEQREEELDEYLSREAGRADAQCLSPDELRLFNDGRAG